MSQFVDACRQEWRRLGVPDPAANEMAADLEADLIEAESEGVSAEEVLGNGAFDPRSFAESWAKERGLIQPPAFQPAPVGHRTKQPRMFSLVLAFAVLAVVGAVFAIAGSHEAGAVVMRKPLEALPAPPIRPPAELLQPGAVQGVAGLDRFHAAGPLLLLIGGIGLITMLVLWSWRRLRPPVAPA